MCRLFGFRSVIPSMVHKSLVNADNALMAQSKNHPDGWGVAYYVSHAPHVIKSAESALTDYLFRRVSGIVTSETVLAHIRRATQGDLNILNTHPFQFGPWVFAHNGNISNFPKARTKLLKSVDPELRGFILGDTDSELLFFLVLTHLKAKRDLFEPHCPLKPLAEAARAAVADVEKVTGPFCQSDEGISDGTYLTFIITNGTTMLAHQGGKPLFYSTYKTQCSERDHCQSFAPECEAASTTGKVNHFILTSEHLKGENVFLTLNPGDIIGIDESMRMILKAAKATE